MATLLVELFCEELPPKALSRLGEAFAEGLQRGLAKREMISNDSAVRAFATPRRLAASITNVKGASEPRAVEVKLMPVSVALDASGNATPALLKKLEAAGLAGTDVAKLQRRVDGKAEMLFAQARTPATPLAQALQGALDEAIAGLPIPKVMSYQLADGETTVQFVRPAHGLVALHGGDVVAVRALGLDSGRVTHGHRFQGARDVELADAEAYEGALEREGRVIASFAARREEIAKQLNAKARDHSPRFAPPQALLDEVTGLVEWPAVYVGSFEEEFLAVPQECLVLTMQQNQKYFPLVAENGKLLPKFLIVSNMRLDDARNIVEGNGRVVRPRLADARFFFETDKKVKLADRVPQLASIVYHNKLGSQMERVERLRRLASRIQSMLPRGEKGRPYADRAALLAKADLVTLMVGEFPELQGVMGKYYAEADGEEPSVVRAIEQHYWPRYSGDQLPVGDVSIALALADKIETLVGIWGVGQQPTGDKDPFGLRRAALGVLRILSEKPEAAALDLRRLLDEAASGFRAGALAADTAAGVHLFMLERLRSMMRDKGYDANEIEAVLAGDPANVGDTWKRIEAVRAFRALPEADALAAANKRIKNILRKSGTSDAVNYALLTLPEERNLHRSYTATEALVMPAYEAGKFDVALKGLAGMRDDVDAFFDKVLVNAEDPKVRDARLAFLQQISNLMNVVADISKLAA
ncbi:MAG: glycine--tRNA ligase subunit beta [Usitatibacter sp.]